MASYTRRLAIAGIGAFALLATSACAVYAQGRHLPSGQVTSRGAQAQYESGYRQGLRAGEIDARRGERFNYRNERSWQRGRHDYAFREGFEEGYRRGYVGRGGSGGYGGSWGRGSGGSGGYGGRVYADPAMARGFEDGYRQGRDDARSRQRFDPVRARDYRAGDRGYDRRYGSRDNWKIAYRQAFREGYERGYREVR